MLSDMAYTGLIHLLTSKTGPVYFLPPSCSSHLSLLPTLPSPLYPLLALPILSSCPPYHPILLYQECP